MPANIDLALALPTLSVVLGSRRGGRGAGRPEDSLRGNVAYCCGVLDILLYICSLGLGTDCRVTTVMLTRSPDFRIRSTTFSCEAVETSSPLIATRKSPFLSPAMSATPPLSTSSRYCRPGYTEHIEDSIRGEAALAPRNTNPNPRLERCKTTVRV
uniref:Uncharacterized protein n=1 Tax=Cacopsylla melanoneura TaxID=428564 RepID=A0A8D8LTG5_9HEMI